MRRLFGTPGSLLAAGDSLLRSVRWLGMLLTDAPRAWRPSYDRLLDEADELGRSDRGLALPCLLSGVFDPDCREDFSLTEKRPMNSGGIFLGIATLLGALIESQRRCSLEYGQ